MKILLLGASGFIGPFIADALAEAGHAVVAVSRGPRDWRDGVTNLVADRNDADAIAQIARRERADAVIDLLGYTLKDSQPLFEALAGRVGRYVLASSGDVYQRYGALHRKEDIEDRVSALDEDASLRTHLYPYRGETPRAADDPRRWLDDYDKIPIEGALLAKLGLAGTIVRLPMVFGPGDKQHRFGWIIQPMLRRDAVLEVDPLWWAWRASYAYVEDVGHAVALAATHPAASGRIYNLAMADAPDHAEWIARFARVADWRGEVRSRIWTKANAGWLESLDLTCMLTMASTRIRKELGYAETVDAEIALARTIDDERDYPKR